MFRYLKVFIVIFSLYALGEVKGNLLLSCNPSGPLWTPFDKISLNVKNKKCHLKSHKKAKLLKKKTLKESDCNTWLNEHKIFLGSDSIIPRRVNPKLPHVKMSWVYKSKKRTSSVYFPGHKECNAKGKCSDPPVSKTAEICFSLMQLLGH